jgi:hypothetical protein
MGDADPCGEREITRERPARKLAGNGSNREAMTALGAAASQHLATVGGLHAGTEAVIALALEIAGLIGAFGCHGGVSKTNEQGRPA